VLEGIWREEHLLPEWREPSENRRSKKETDEDFPDKWRMTPAPEPVAQSTGETEQKQHLKQEDEQVLFAEMRSFGYHVMFPSTRSVLDEFRGRALPRSNGPFL
jgi:hypothetical protein